MTNLSKVCYNKLRTLKETLLEGSRSPFNPFTGVLRRFTTYTPLREALNSMQQHKPISELTREEVCKIFLEAMGLRRQQIADKKQYESILKQLETNPDNVPSDSVTMFQFSDKSVVEQLKYLFRKS